jgi:hypothetical protein
LQCVGRRSPFPSARRARRITLGAVGRTLLREASPCSACRPAQRGIGCNGNTARQCRSRAGRGLSRKRRPSERWRRRGSSGRTQWRARPRCARRCPPARGRGGNTDAAARWQHGAQAVTGGRARRALLRAVAEATTEGWLMAAARGAQAAKGGQCARRPACPAARWRGEGSVSRRRARARSMCLRP